MAGFAAIWGRWTSRMPIWTRTNSCRESAAPPPKPKRVRRGPRRPGGPRRRWPRRTRATACRPCPSSASWSTAATGSSASRRSWCQPGTWRSPTGLSPDEIDRLIREQFRAYRATLQEDRRHLLERFRVVDLARKVVGMGSVGTRAFIVLLQGRPAPGSSCSRVATSTTRCPCRSRRHRLGPGGPPAQEPLPAARRAGGPGAADDAGGQRPFPGLDQGGPTPAATTTGASCGT
jgi:hypothetical protein